MTAALIDGRRISAALRADLKEQADRFAAAVGRPPTIAVIWVGADAPSEQYARQIHREFERNGFGVRPHPLAEETPESELVALLGRLDRDPAVDGVLVETPLPPHVDVARVSLAIPVQKDVDGVHPVNAGFLFTDTGSSFAPATPAGGIELLERIGVSAQGKRAAVVGRSASVGKPMAFMLLHRNATVTICHSHTERLAEVVREAEILVAAAGVPRLIKGDWIRPGAVVIDFGVNVTDGGVVGDVDFESAARVAGWITPVPGGTGPMTVTMLMKNTLFAARRQHPTLTG
ncbi:MAG TPA: bifunctional 5,10-methylenetetrahydrofolate dehydrogenase/5,10-methenyltetrahydrofolate cyclohydrolase [Chloroflexota bacterium]|nr:bifunctional 5,10-methylenetetrahydrofolate dehydrogenase/5,10-methenyltetrahydrofolate cyclohydrolase [Chloroflexota bacterium]